MSRPKKIQLTDQGSIDQEIKRSVNDLMAKENLASLGKSFVLWVLMDYFDLDRETATSKVIDGGNDKNVDAFMEEDETINIVQCKFFDDPSKEVGDTEVASFKGCIDWLKNPEDVRKLNVDRLYDAAVTFSERWHEGIDIQLHFFTFGKFSSGAKQERVVFNRADPRVQMYFHDADDIRTIFLTRSRSENPLARVTVELELIPGEYFERKGKASSIVATIKGKDLLSIYEKYGDILFERNIRLYKGARKGSINAKIIETVLDDKEQANFWFYNNGLSFVCSGYWVNKNVTPHILEVTSPQVINGCQTTVCLLEAKERSKNWEEIPPNVQVLIRFIKVPVKEVDLITLYTNSQNPVSEMQLRSNDPVQGRLKKDLANFERPYFYSIKEGDWQKLLPQEKRKYQNAIIEMSEAAQAIFAFTSDPAFARRFRNRLFSEKYNDIFRKDLTVEEVILPWRILGAINERIAKYRRDEFNRFKKESPLFTEEQKIEIQRKEFLLYSNIIILYFVGNLIKKRYGQYSATIAKKLLNNQLENRIGRIFDYVTGVLSYSENLAKEKNLPRFLKNIDSINTLYTEIQRELLKDQARLRKDPLADMLPEIKT